jgi:hypothetical protein
MSATLNFNKHKYYSWKDKTFSQVTSSIKKNIGTIPQKYNNITNYFLANPLKIYRREIATSQISCNSRTSVKIDELNRPNGYLVYNSDNTTGINMPLDMNLINSNYELNTPMCNNSLSCFNPASNALKRVRSSGMIPKKLNLGLNNDQYCTNTNQYLTSRNKTFQQNQYNYLKYDNHCNTGYIPIVYKPNNSQFAQQGAVDSSALISRLKYDTITGIGSKLRSPSGNQITNTLAYAVPNGTFSKIKKEGNPFPLKSTPKFCKFNNNRSVIMCKSV